MFKKVLEKDSTGNTMSAKHKRWVEKLGEEYEDDFQDLILVPQSESNNANSSGANSNEPAQSPNIPMQPDNTNKPVQQQDNKSSNEPAWATVLGSKLDKFLELVTAQQANNDSSNIENGLPMEDPNKGIPDNKTGKYEYARQFMG